MSTLLVDFVRGNPESLTTQFPDRVIDVIMLYRDVDQFTDSHASFLDAKKFLSPERRRFAGIIMDIFFDHSLAHHWQEYSDGPLKIFISEVYRTLDRRTDWLGSYCTIDGLALTFRRLSSRQKFLSPLIEAKEGLPFHYHSFSKVFHIFYPQVMEFAKVRDS